MFFCFVFEIQKQDHRKFIAESRHNKLVIIPLVVGNGATWGRFEPRAKEFKKTKFKNLEF